MQLIYTLDTPTLLVIGGDRGIVSPMLVAELSNLNRSLEYMQIDEAVHGIPYDKTEQLSVIVKSFLLSVNA